MANKLMHDRSGNVSSKRILLLVSGFIFIIISGYAGLGHLYFLFVKNIPKDLNPIISLLAVLSGFMTLIAGIATLGEKKD